MTLKTHLKHGTITEHKEHQDTEQFHWNSRICSTTPTVLCFLQYSASKSLTLTDTSKWFLWVARWKQIRLSHKTEGLTYCEGFVKLVLTNRTTQNLTIQCFPFRRTRLRYPDRRSFYSRFTSVLAEKRTWSMPWPLGSRQIKFYACVSVHHKSILYKEPTRCNFGSIVY